MTLQQSSKVRAPLRWAGSKRKSLPFLAHHLPSRINHYVEPFAGSACLAFTIKARRFVLGDINSNLIEFYEALKTTPRKLYKLYSNLPRNPATYYAIREEYNYSRPSLKRAAQFLYLNRLCFNGIYRVNAKGHFNVPWGGDNVGLPLSRTDIEKASGSLSNAAFVCDDFEKVIDASVKPGTFVYLDPPFATDETRVFREYHENSFASCDWNRLLAALHRIDDAKGFFLLSYAGPASLKKDLGNWNAGYLDVTRNVGGFRATRRKHREFIATNYILHT